MIVVVGSINMDICFAVPHIPAIGETVLSTGMHCNSGGKGANQAVAAAKLGGDVHMIGRVGVDDYGSELLRNLTEYGVNTQSIVRDENNPSGTAFINVSADGDNAITVSSGANGAVDEAQIRGHEALFRKAQYCITQLEIPLAAMLATAEMCKRTGSRLVLNPSPVQPLPDDLLRSVAYLIPNEKEAMALFGVNVADGDDQALMDIVTAKSMANMVVTLGEKGCIWVTKDAVHRYPALSVQAVDTTGAGDCFLGAFTTGLSQGKTVPDAISFATKAASITVTRHGAQQSMPTLSEM